MSEGLDIKQNEIFCNKCSTVEWKKELETKFKFVESMIHPECLDEYNKYKKWVMDLVEKYPNSLKDKNVQTKIDENEKILTEKLWLKSIAVNNRKYRWIILDYTEEKKSA